MAKVMLYACVSCVGFDVAFLVADLLRGKPEAAVLDGALMMLMALLALSWQREHE